MTIKLSILILTTPRRRGTFFQRLLDKLEAQVGELPVEIIGIYDNKRRSVGSKRNAALAMAQGEYVCFFDDDDTPADDYVISILDCIDKNPGVDTIVFDCITTIHKDGKPVEKHYSKYSKDFDYTINNTPDANGFKQWRGKPSHTCVHRMAHVRQYAFPDKNYGEDVDFCSRVSANIKTEARIDKVLYFYNFNPLTSETR